MINYTLCFASLCSVEGMAFEEHSGKDHGNERSMAENDSPHTKPQTFHSLRSGQL